VLSGSAGVEFRQLSPRRIARFEAFHLVNCTTFFKGSMTLFPKLSLEGVKTISIKDKPRKVSKEDLAEVYTPSAQGEFDAFLRSLPNTLKAQELKEFAQKVSASRREGKKFAVLMGAHVIKTGLSPILIDLMERAIITSLSMNSASAIHDSESALFGMTSEDVEANIQDGTFGMSRETGEFINNSLAAYVEQDDIGYGEAIGLSLQKANAPFIQNSILATAVKLKIPVTVHAAIGTDIVHQQPTMRGDVTGEMSFRDFRLLISICAELTGGIAVNIGSSVIMPEVFLKAVTVARNLGLGARDITTANFDMLQHYRPQMNVLIRPTRPNSKYYSFTGHHEIMIPLFAAMIKYYAQNQ